MLRMLPELLISSLHRIVWACDAHDCEELWQQLSQQAAALMLVNACDIDTAAIAAKKSKVAKIGAEGTLFARVPELLRRLILPTGSPAVLHIWCSSSGHRQRLWHLVHILKIGLDIAAAASSQWTPTPHTGVSAILDSFFRTQLCSVLATIASTIAKTQPLPLQSCSSTDWNTSHSDSDDCIVHVCVSLIALITQDLRPHFSDEAQRMTSELIHQTCMCVVRQEQLRTPAHTHSSLVDDFNIPLPGHRLAALLNIVYDSVRAQSDEYLCSDSASSRNGVQRQSCFSPSCHSYPQTRRS